MDGDWERLEGVEATERILSAALSDCACDIHVASDPDGATVYFGAEQNLSVFARIPTDCRDAVVRYLRNLAAIDHWRNPPATGAGHFQHKEQPYTVEVEILRGAGGEDAMIHLSRS